MAFELFGTAQDLGRLHEIGSVLVRQGLGDLAGRIGLVGLLERAGRAIHWDGASRLAERKEPQARVRQALEELGPTFVKLGQLLAGRNDLLPPAWTEELSRLHEGAKPVPFERIAKELERDLGAPPGEVFRDLEEEPLAAASIAQVHRARLADGTPVVLKVRRPGIVDVLESDLHLLGRLAQLAEQELVELRRFRPRRLMRHFARSMRDELDMRNEARNARRFRENLAERPELVVPRIHDEWTSERLCVMDYLEGPSVGDWLRGEPADHDPRWVARVGADAILHMVFADGFFHADPHPGNVLLLPDGRLGLLDFGMVGVLPEARRREFVDLLLGIVDHRVEDVVEILLDWSHEGETDVDLLREDCSSFIDRYYGVPMRSLDTIAVVRDVGSLLRENDLYLPNDVAMLLKLFVTLESLGRSLDPDFVVSAHLEPFARRVTRLGASPLALGRHFLREIRGIVTSLPREVRRALATVRGGRIRFDVNVRQLERFGQKIDRSASRVAVGLVTSALIVGTAITMTVSGGPRLFGLPVWALIGFVSSFVFGVWLVFSVWRSGRRS